MAKRFLYTYVGRLYLLMMDVYCAHCAVIRHHDLQNNPGTQMILVSFYDQATSSISAPAKKRNPL